MNSMFSKLPYGLLTDSYKLSHYRLYPDATKAVAYGEFRKPFDDQKDDQRIVFYGIRHIIESYLCKQWTVKDVDTMEAFLATHRMGNTAYPFPKELFLKFIKENDGYFPIKVQALPEGSVVYPHVPVFQITAEGEYAILVTYLESILCMCWYPSTVATLSRKVRTILEKGFEQSVDEENYGMISGMLNDFGFRGCACVEQSILGGMAHLLNFDGTDNLPAAFCAQYEFNSGKPVGTTVPATEHSVMTAHKTELGALQRAIAEYGDGVMSCVMDSYDYARALSELLPVVKEQKLAKGGVLVIRPDSGDPVEAVLMALEAGEKVFGVQRNTKGYKVLNGCAVLQGDGISLYTVGDLVKAVLGAGYSIQNVAFGMGGGLLQKVHRDTMSFAVKISSITYHDGKVRDIMKCPKSDSNKKSLPGCFAVLGSPDENNGAKCPPIVYHCDQQPDSSIQPTPPSKEINKDQARDGADNILRVVYDKGPVQGAWEGESFDKLRKRIRSQWDAFPPVHDAISESLKRYQEQIMADQENIG
ncbi:hypothetical protein H4219_002325 [Mycoemilia scoparia]|uniref:Nicotinamide phosphoribosyltransferase n=1 Tax=Mycoemilia scoparia TaxID=417184 RepID=A0A9W8A1F8_9FUNG|nr:hypothetical protein H4219_002325 [Mycoemilia scoparia]